jgi:murein tripeptide amidase MpaA
MAMKRIMIFLLSLALGGLTLFAQRPEESILVSLPRTADVLRALPALALDLVAEWEGRVYISASSSDLERIERLRLPLRYDAGALAPHLSAPAAAGGSPIGAYHTHAELGADLFALQAAYPQLAKVRILGMSLENRPIYALRVSDNPQADEGEPAVLFLGCHHAREWISVEVPFLLGKYLLENYAADPEIKRLVDGTDIWIVPMVNPDGHDYTVQVYRYWRKNRRANGGGEYGVDLNRNYGYAWGYDNSGSSPNPASAVYRGSSAFSEPETRAVRDLVLGRDFGAMITYHSYSQVILYPWGYTKLPSAQDALLRSLGNNFAARIAAVNGRNYVAGPAGTTLYVTNGSTDDWTFALTGMPSYTIELPPIDEAGGGFFNAEADIAPIFQENLAAMLYLIAWMIEHPRPIPESPFDLRSLLRAPRIVPRNPPGQKTGPDRER